MNAPATYANARRCTSTTQDAVHATDTASVRSTGDMASVLDDTTNEATGDTVNLKIPLTTPTISIMKYCRVPVPPVADPTLAKDEKDPSENKVTTRNNKSASIQADTTHVPPSLHESDSKSVLKLSTGDTISPPPPPKPTAKVDPFSREIVERKMKALFNKLTERTFESISGQVLEYVNRSSVEEDGRTTKLVVKLICDKAVEDHFWARLYAQMCESIWKGVDKGMYISAADDPLYGLEGEALFRHCLLKHCQREFLAGLSHREGKAAETTSSHQDPLAPPTNGQETEDGSAAGVVFSDEYYANEAVKRKAKGLIKFMGELYNAAMLGTGAILQVFSLLIDKDIYGTEQFEIKLACGLLTTISTEFLRHEAAIPRGEKIKGIVEQLKSIQRDPRTSIRTSCYLQVCPWVVCDSSVSYTKVHFLMRNTEKASIELLEPRESGAEAKTAVNENNLTNNPDKTDVSSP